MKRVVLITLITAIIVGGLTLSATAEHKLDRGPKNIALGWTEVPNSIVNVTKETDNPLLGITVGLLKGVLNAFARTASGVWDTATFPVNSQGEKPAIKPGMVEAAEGK
ncbi:MAG: exosortase system-associated protein, TIGR04073 family [Candidatus Omnitrophota bacterium]